MAQNSKIEWTEATWNVSTGCTKISPGCLNCYAERFAKRLQKMGLPKYRNGFKFTTHPEELNKPLQWKKPRLVFVNSMSDLFHEEMPLEFLQQVFKIMNQAHWHIFQILTKRSYRLRELAPQLSWSKNIWVGVTVENNDYLYRLDDLITVTQASIRFISFEPLLGPINISELEKYYKTGLINWVIVGGESGPKARPMKKEWVTQIRDLTLKHNIPFFFKQWGGTNKKKSGRLLDGRRYNDFPF